MQYAGYIFRATKRVANNKTRKKVDRLYSTLSLLLDTQFLEWKINLDIRNVCITELSNVNRYCTHTENMQGIFIKIYEVNPMNKILATF